MSKRGANRAMTSLVATLLFTTFAFLGVTACGNPLKPRIDAEKRQVAEAKDRFNQIRKEVEADVQKEPDLFRSANVAAAWRDRFQTGQEKLNDASTNLERLNHRDKEQLFGDVVRLREAAVADAVAIQNEANRWLDLKHNTAKHIDRMKDDVGKIGLSDTSQLSAAITKAGSDWPAKKNDLDARLTALKSAPEQANATWKDAQAAAAKPDYAALMADERKLDELAALPDIDRKQVGQLYDSWDKLLVNLEGPHGADPTCREKVKVITTHFTDVKANESQTDSTEKWVDIPQSTYASLQNDIGMTIEHKPAGAYDTEAEHVPQPPGFAYMAPPGQSNQYGHWENQNGSSVWTWLPQYLILRELLWNHQPYYPIPVYEYQGYWAARRSGVPYYGRDEQVQSAPKYGTHGTFTGGRYADSRYAQRGGSYRDSQYKNSSGGYRSSPYAGSPSSSNGSSEQGHQFGRAPSSSPSSPSSSGRSFGGGSGKRFGSGGGSHSAPSGRSFGRRR